MVGKNHKRNVKKREKRKAKKRGAPKLPPRPSPRRPPNGTTKRATGERNYKRGPPTANPLQQLRAFLNFKTTQDGRLIITGRDFLAPIGTSEIWDITKTGVVMQKLNVSPQSLPNTRLGLLAAMYQKYRCLSFQVHFNSSSPSSDNGTGNGATGAGSIMGVIFDDPADVDIGEGDQALSIARAVPNSHSTNLWKNTTWSWKPKDSTVYFIDPKVMPDDTAEQRQETQALFVLLNEGVIPSINAPIGNLWVTYTYELLAPVYRADEQIGYRLFGYKDSGTSGTMTATTIVNDSNFHLGVGSSITPAFEASITDGVATADGLDLHAMGVQTGQVCKISLHFDATAVSLTGATHIFVGCQQVTAPPHSAGLTQSSGANFTYDYWFYRSSSNDSACKWAIKSGTLNNTSVTGWTFSLLVYLSNPFTSLSTKKTKVSELERKYHTLEERLSRLMLFIEEKQKEEKEGPDDEQDPVNFYISSNQPTQKALNNNNSNLVVAPYTKATSPVRRTP